MAYSLSGQRKINLYGEIYEASLAHVDNALDYLISVDKRKPIEIFMNTPGGSVVNGFAIYDTIMKKKKMTPINITVIGACMSMGVLVLQAATERRAMDHAAFLMHEVSFDPGRETTSNHADRLRVASRLQQQIDAVIIGRSHIGQELLDRLTKRKDYTIDSKEALEHGLIDLIV